MKKLEYLRSGDFIGITAPSDGLGEEVDNIRLESAKKKLEERGYHLLETNSVRKSVKGRSASAEVRAKEFMELVKKEEVKYILSACGGDYLMEILPYLDFDVIAKNPKWIQGYSDNTGLLFPITTMADIPTVYAGNVGDYGMADWHRAVCNNIEIIEGKIFTERKFDLYEPFFTEKITGLEGYSLQEKVEYKVVSGEEKVDISGRLIGGCLDVLINLCGTRYDMGEKFARKYAEDGLIWYMESFALPAARVEMALWQLKEAGWFYGAKGFLFGRPCFFKEEYEVSFEEAVRNALSPLGVPIITGCDIGHRPPRLTMINGMPAEVKMNREDFRLTYIKE